MKWQIIEKINTINSYLYQECPTRGPDLVNTAISSFFIENVDAFPACNQKNTRYVGAIRMLTMLIFCVSTLSLQNIKCLWFEKWN